MTINIITKQALQTDIILMRACLSGLMAVSLQSVFDSLTVVQQVKNQTLAFTTIQRGRLRLWRDWPSLTPLYVSGCCLGLTVFSSSSPVDVAITKWTVQPPVYIFSIFSHHFLHLQLFCVCKLQFGSVSFSQSFNSQVLLCLSPCPCNNFSNNFLHQ